MHLTGLADVELLVRMLEKEGGLVGPTLKKKKKKPGLDVWHWFGRLLVLSFSEFCQVSFV